MNLASSSHPTVIPDEIAGPLLNRWLAVRDKRPGQAGERGEVGERGETDERGKTWIAELLPEAAQLLGGEAVHWVFQAGARWSVWSATTESDAVTKSTLSDPELLGLVTDAIEAEGPLIRGGLAAVPLTIRPAFTATDRIYEGSPVVLSVSAQKVDSQRLRDVARVLAAIVGAGERLDQLTGLTARLRFLLDAANRWAAIEDTDELLGSIAAAAADLLKAERASIFLWEKKRGKLVGRPALGVAGGQLEVDDDAGVVGAVLGSGEPRTWAAIDDPEAEVNRTVDRQLHFVTRSLAAVPMRSPHGQLLGVFEVLNKRDDGTGCLFDAADVQALTDLASHAAAAIHSAQTRQRLTQTRDRLLNDAAATYRVIGNSPAICELRETVARVAPTELAVLVLGENGTGKEVVARSLHFQSHRRDEPFVAVNCAALVESLLESELFGHERGAFTDAHQSRPGKFELASGGTLFLDEIGDMSPGGQAKLLRVLEEKIIVRVGGSTPIPVDVRIIAATNQSLPELVLVKRFREDLFFRLNVVSLRLPPLRDRGDDILLLGEHFLDHFAMQTGRGRFELDDSARRTMLGHRWPGNIRELRNVMERACYLSQATTLSDADLGLVATHSSSESAASDRTSLSFVSAGSVADGMTPAGGINLADATRDFQVTQIDSAIARHRGNMTAAAAALGLHRSNLYRKMRQLGMTGETSVGKSPENQ